MESESAGDADAAREEPIVFISDASAEAERVSLALNARGWQVADVPLSLLAGRILVQRPALVICDADAEGAAETLQKIRQQSPEDPVAVILVGERDGRIAHIDVGLVRAVFARPVNVPELVGTAERLIGTAEGGSLPPGPRGKLGTSSRPPARPTTQSVAPKPGSVRAGDPSDPALQLPPELAGEPVATRGTPAEAPIVELSGEIQAMLLAAERKLGGAKTTAGGGDDPGPEADFEAALPPEVLAALEDPLDEDEALGRSNAPEPDLEGTAAGAGLGGRTQGGLTSLGTDAALPPSEHGHTSLLGNPGATSIQPAPIDSRRSGRPGEPSYPAGPPDPGDPESGEDEAKRKRQQASTPKPPRPGASDLLTSDSPDGALLMSLPPPTAFDPALQPDPRSQLSRAINEDDDIDDELDEELVESDTSERNRPPSTSPPHRATRQVTAIEREHTGTRADRATDRPEATRAGIRSDMPSARLSGERDSERPGTPRQPLVDDRPSMGRTLLEERASSPRHPVVDERPSAPQQPLPESERPSSPRSGPDSERPGPGRATPPAEQLAIPSVLRTGDAAFAMARAIRTRYSGALAFEVDEGIRRVVLREGDFVTAISGVHGESLVAFLAARGDVPPEVARLGHKLPAFGRRAGAALIAHGHLAQDELWPVLRGHAEWIIGKIVAIDRGAASVEALGRLEDEPAVFGGATGAEILVEVIRRVLPPDEAVNRLGGPGAVLTVGPARNLLEECALTPNETERVLNSDGSPLGAVLDGPVDASLASVIYALVALGGLTSQAARPLRDAPAKKPPRDEIDDEALRARILARKALVDEGDYFAVLGVPRTATAYDIRRAYTTLKQEFEPSRSLSTQTADLRDTVTEILDVLDEAHEILSDQRRRERYRRAIEATP